jgi:hypothetical protein
LTDIFDQSVNQAAQYEAGGLLQQVSKNFTELVIQRYG